MFFYEGYSCPVCEKPFTENDDIVTCPVCGAPHHRVCWQQEKNCHYADTHGTPQQWSRESDTPQEKTTSEIPVARFCPRCGQQNSVYAEFCSRCGGELHADDWTKGGQPFSSENTNPAPPYPPYGSPYREYRPFQAPVSPHLPDDNIETDGVTVRELRIFTGQNALYYLPRFLKLAQTKSSVNWNWAAFLFTPYWLWYRKQYLFGSLVLLFRLFYYAVTAFFAYRYLGLSAATLTMESLFNAMQNLLGDPAMMRWMLILDLTLFVDMLIRLLFGLTGNYLYYRTACKRINKLPDRTSVDAIARSGGISFALAAAAYAVLNIASTMIGAVFMSL